MNAMARVPTSLINSEAGRQAMNVTLVYIILHVNFAGCQ